MREIEEELLPLISEVGMRGKAIPVEDGRRVVIQTGVVVTLP